MLQVRAKRVFSGSQILESNLQCASKVGRQSGARVHVHSGREGTEDIKIVKIMKEQLLNRRNCMPLAR